MFQVSYTLSCIFLLILAAIVAFEFTMAIEKQFLVRQKNSVAAFLITIFLALEFIIGFLKMGRIPGSWHISNGLAVAGCLLIIIRVVINIFARIQLGKMWSNDIRIYADHVLVNKGLYRFIRHPLYVGMILIAFGLALLFGNYLSFILTILVFIPLIHYRTIKEEKVLLENLAGYKEYMQNTARFIPFSIFIRKIFGGFHGRFLGTFFSTREDRVTSWSLRLCRASTVLLLLLAIVFQIKWLVYLVLLLMAYSAIVSISKAPFVKMYSAILRKGSRSESVDVNAIRFAQGLGSVLLIISIILDMSGYHIGSWIMVATVLLSTAFGTMGYCLGAYIYFGLRKAYRKHA